LLDAEKAEYETTGKFIWKRGLQPMAVAMKKGPAVLIRRCIGRLAREPFPGRIFNAVAKTTLVTKILFDGSG
jgi:hypothetical protein